MIARVNSDNDYDVIIIGAGISGINFAYRLQTQNPDLSYTILEGRDAIGGTWDLFKYPGVRSDSDLYTFGFPWRPWTEQRAIAEGSLILDYVKESAAVYSIEQEIKFKHHVDGANWSSEQQAWSINVNVDNEPRIFRSRFMLLCADYYDYNEALPAVIHGIESFAGKVVRPQFWPRDLNYAGKNIVVIGTGATAITLLPALSETASHVTMLQRSPTYLLSRPSVDKFEILMRKLFSERLTEKVVRTKWLVVPFLFSRFARNFPGLAKRLLRNATVKQLPSSIEYDKHFKPAYNPFQQRICVSPDGDFFASLRSGKASVVTATFKASRQTQSS